jgi:hypothetical protein
MPVLLPTQGAIAAWIPIIFEIAGCLIVLFLKLWYEHTAAGRRFSAAKQQQQRELPLDDISAWDQQQQQQDGQAQDRYVRALGAAAAAALGSSGDISWRGRAVLGQHQEAPSGLVIPMVDVSVRNGSRHGSRNGSMHGNMHGHDTANGSQQDVSAAGRQEQEGTQQKLGAALNKAAGAAGPDSACDNSTALEVRCIGTSVGSASTTSIPAAATSEGLPCFAGGVSQHVQASAAAGALYHSSVQQQQQQQPIEPLFASTWSHQALEPMHVPKGGR